MYKRCKPLFLLCESPLHVGSGADLGIVDLPIQRERHTGFPKVESSSFKGAAREAIETKAVRNASDSKEALANLVKINKVFGYDDDPVRHDINKQQLENEFSTFIGGRQEVNTSFAGAIGFTDARLLLFPMKSVKGVFAWITCRRVLQQFEADMRIALGDTFKIPALHDGSLANDGTYLLSDRSSIIYHNHVVLEDYTFPVTEVKKDGLPINHEGENTRLGHWLAKHICPTNFTYWQEKMKHDIVILPDDDFADFVTLSTEVITRTKIDNGTGTVADGALFTEEYLPSESVLYNLILAHDEFTKSATPMKADEVLAFVAEQLPDHLQLGANLTLGKGLMRTGKHFLTQTLQHNEQ